MLSYNKGVPIAKNGDKIIYLNNNNYISPSAECYEKIKQLDKKDKKILLESLKSNIEPNNKNLIKLYKDCQNDRHDDKATMHILSNNIIQILPRIDICEKLYISGVSGSGKSTYVGKYISEYINNKSFKNNNIYVFSSVDKDDSLDKYNIIRIPIDDDLIDEPLLIEDFKNSLTIYDDTDTIKNKNYRNAINDIKGEMIEIGRHYDARCIITSHILTNYASTRQILNECTSITFYPKSSGVYHIKNYLKVYAGLDKKQIDKILKLNSRWITIYRTYPSYIVWEHGISILSEF